MNKLINIACWSVGEHAIRNILPAIQECKNINLSGIYTRDQNVSNEQNNLYGSTQYQSEAELLSALNVDAVYLSSPTGVHYEQINKCLDAGKSVLVEKTALPCLKKTQELISKAESKGLTIMEAFMYRFHKQFTELKKLIINKKYGNVIKIECEFGFPHLASDNIRYQKKLCGGATFDVGAYTLSSVRQLLGHKTKVQWAKILTFSEFEVDTSGWASLTAGDAVANCSWNFGGSYSNKIRVWCENGHISCDRAYSKAPNFESNIVVEHNGVTVETLNTGKDNHFINMLTHFSKILVSSNSTIEHKELEEQSKLVNSVFSFH